jgi:hypothetical protein
MKIIHSLWTKPLFKNKNLNAFDRFMGGWSEKRFNYMSWTLSCLQFKSFYENIELYTDEYGKKILIDILDFLLFSAHFLKQFINCQISRALHF